MRVSSTAVVASMWWLTCSHFLVANVASTPFVQLHDDLLAARSLSFSDAIMEPVPQSLLAAIEYGGTLSPNLITCDVAETTSNSGQATVLVAISKCLNVSSIALIEAWVNSIKATKLEYMENGAKKKLTFATTLIKDQCGDPKSTSTLVSGYKAAELLSDEVQFDDVARIQSFARFGHVLAEAPTAWNAVPVAVISFVKNAKSYDYVTQYENRFNISKTFRFQFCQDGGINCDGRYQNTVILDQNVDLFLYNPFTLVSSTTCGKLTDGIPIEYVNSKGSRDCFCTCTASSQIEDSGYGKKCVSVETETCPCVWNTMGGFIVTNKENLTQCKLSKFATDRGLPVPNPQDNYVANKVNQDELTTGPRIEVTVTPTYSTVYEYTGTASVNPNELPQKVAEMTKKLGQSNTRVSFTPTATRGKSDLKKYSWLDFRQNSKAKIDELTMTAYGKYELLLVAYDYRQSAQCVGCVAVVDGFRPKRTTQCPAAFRDTAVQASVATAELTTANVAKAAKLVKDFYDVQLNAANDACSADPKTRCDYEDFKLKTFFTTDYATKPIADGKTFFSMTEIEADFKKGAVTNPLEAKARDGTACQESVFVPPTECTRCGRYESRLREYWTDYRCGYDYSMQYCSGDASETCVFQQCLVLTGPSVASVSVAIKPAVVTESKRVISIARFPPTKSTATQIHRVVSCSAFNNNCNYKAGLADLFDVTVANKLGGATSNFVFWRYNLDCDTAVGWRLWNPSSSSPVHIFRESTVVITVEAWTACGLVNKWTFTVYVYLSSGQRQQWLMLATNTEAETAPSTVETTPVLLALAAVVAVAALVVVRRRRARDVKDDQAISMNDAYRPLLH